MVRAKGEYVWDEQGKRYLDAIGGIVCISAGHNHPKVKKKLMKRLEKVEIQHTSLLYRSRHVTELAEALVAEVEAYAGPDEAAELVRNVLCAGGYCDKQIGRGSCRERV